MFLKLTSFLVLLAVSTANDVKNVSSIELTVPDVIQFHGYPSEIHTVTTEDGYVLEMHRIPYGIKGPSANRKAVFLQHGLLCSSADWVLTGPQKGLAFVLADAGYDVWMGNSRGNFYSRKHVKYDPDKQAKSFWDFSWHEIGIYDLPAMIDYVTKSTGQEKIFYIGHSQGTTAFFVMGANKPNYNDKIRSMFALAPVAYTKNIFSPIVRLIATFNGPLGMLLNMIGSYEFLPRTDIISKPAGILCGSDSSLMPLCMNTLFALCGFNSQQFNKTLLPDILAHTPAGASTRQVRHFAQGINSGKFRQWDYGTIGNMKRYGSLSPPKYKLNNVKAPTYLFYSSNDWLSSDKDVLKLYKELPNVKGKFLTVDKKFNHLDFLFGIDAYDLLYIRILSLMSKL